jgi:biopolymer transport protein ExbD
MAGVDVGTGSGKRDVNSDINMIPFIDLLMVTIAFLLITAVWVSYSRMNANAQVPGLDSTTPPTDRPVEKVLHLHANQGEFQLVWKQGSTVVDETTVPRQAVEGAAMRYPDLADKIEEQWKLHGGHQDPSDQRPDQLVLHTRNDIPFGEIVATMDAVYQAKREMNANGKTRQVPAFNLAFASR